MTEQSIYREISSRDHALHVWINRRQEERRRAGEPWESTLYEWKSMEAERRRLPLVIRRAFEGALPSMHQQCSRSEPETIAENHLICALGIDVITCPILLSLKAAFEEERQHERRVQERTDGCYEPGLTDESVYQAMGSVCTWHIFTSVFGVAPDRPENRRIDTSEGYVQDESDRRFWATTYAHMAAGLEDDEGEAAS